VFDPDLSQNYLAESFGLTGFVSPAIKRETFTQKLEQQIKQQRAEKSQKISSDTPKRKATPKAPKQKTFRASRKKNPYKKQLIFIAVLLLFMASGWAYMNKHMVQHYYQTYASLVPFFYPSPNEYVATHMNHFGITTLADNSDPKTMDKAVSPAEDLNSGKPFETPESTAVLPEVKTEEAFPTESETDEEQLETPTTVQDEIIPEETIAEPTPEPTKVLIQDPVQNMDQLKYFIIAGAFREKANADKLVTKLRAKGFNAVFAGQTGSGLHRIAFEGHSSRSAALTRLEAIKEEENENAWLFSM
jgi:cell division septation protein DedD